jgi:CHAT domain-containing protein
MFSGIQKGVATALLIALSGGCTPASTAALAEREPPAAALRAESRQAPAGDDRSAIAAAGLDADCARYQSTSDRIPSGRRAWLGAWCGLRSEDWQLARIAATSARSHFAAAGELRRQIEMTLIEAIATDHLRDPLVATKSDSESARDRAAGAHQMWRSSQMPLHGGLRDRFAGDLSYLYARALEQRLLDNPTSPKGHRLTRRVLLDIAQAEYRSLERHEELPYVARASVRRRLQAGELGDALDALAHAFRLDRAVERDPGLRRDLALFSRISALLGMPDVERHVTGVLDSSAGPTTSIALEDLDEASLRQLLDSPAGRARLADALARLRSSAALAIRPPPALLRTLRAHASELDFGARSADGWSPDSWSLAYQSGQLLAEHGHRGEAGRYLRVAVESIEKMRASLPTPALRQRFFADKRKVYMALVDIHVGRDTARRAQSDYRQGLQLANALKARGLLDLLDGRIDASLATRVERATWPARPSVQRTADEVIARLESWTEAARLSEPTPTRLDNLPEAVTDKLDEKTAVLEYLISARRSYVWVLTDGGIEMRRIAGRETLTPLIEAFNTSLAATSNPRTNKHHRKLAERLYVELIGPVEDIVKDVDRLVIAPDDMLYELPFETLARPVRNASTSKNSTHYLVHDRMVSYAPSTAILARLLHRQPAPSLDKALVIGSPDLERPAVDLLSLAEDLPDSGMFSLVDMFPALPGADAELAGVAKHLEAQKLDVDALTGKQAAESWFRHADLTEYGIIHLATHGVSDARALDINSTSRLTFSQPALLLSRVDEQPDDGILTLGELLNRRTAAALVVLSGCTTGRGWHTLGDGAFGLAGALLYTGSHNVIASTWSVTDVETTQLMDLVYAEMAAGRSPAAALRLGQVELIKRGAAPASWAAFRLVGGI